MQKIDAILKCSKWWKSIYIPSIIIELQIRHVNILFKKVTHNILVDRQIQIIVAVTCVLYISYVIEHRE